LAQEPVWTVLEKRKISCSFPDSNPRPSKFVAYLRIIYKCVYLCVCVYVYLYTYIHTHIHVGRSESKERFTIQRYLLIREKKENMQVLSHTFTYFSTWSSWTLRHLYRDTSLLIPSSYQTAAWLFNQSMTECCRSSSSVNRLPPGNYLHSTEHTKRLIWYNETPARVVCANVLYFTNNLRTYYSVPLVP
jgi:hypothetical protein